MKSTCRKFVPWTKEEDFVIEETYLKYSYKEIAEMLPGRTVNGCRNRRLTLCLPLKPRAGRGNNGKWSEEEVRRLHEHYADSPPLRLKALGDELGRDYHNVCRKARFLGLSNQNRKKAKRDKHISFTLAKFTDAQRSEFMSNKSKMDWANGSFANKVANFKFTDEMKAKISEGGKRSWQDPNSGHHSESRNQKLSDAAHKRMTSVAARGYKNPYSRCRRGYRSDLGDVFFRSSWEANYCRYLNQVLYEGMISSWEFECKVFKFGEIKRGVRSYLPDFRITYPDGTQEWHEVKGWMDAKSKLKLKRMAKYYPNEKIVIIGPIWFKEAKKSGLCDSLPNWEK